MRVEKAFPALLAAALVLYAAPLSPLELELGLLRLLAAPVLAGLASYTVKKKLGGKLASLLTYVGVTAPVVGFGCAILALSLVPLILVNPRVGLTAVVALAIPPALICFVYPTVFIAATGVWCWRLTGSKKPLVFAAILTAAFVFANIALVPAFLVGLDIEAARAFNVDVAELEKIYYTSLEAHFSLEFIELPFFVAYGVWIARKMRGEICERA